MAGQNVRIAALVLAVLGGVALVAAAVFLLTEEDETAPIVIVPPEPTALPEQNQGPGPTVADIRVHVSGAVISPGVYSLSEGDRVMDAIAAAGGVQPDADLSALNLALRVQDEVRYHVPAVGETPPAILRPAPVVSSSGHPEAPATPALVDVNAAPADELETLPGIGPVMAGRIVAHREANGPFGSVDDLQDVPGIGPKTLESLRPLVSVGGGQ